MPRIRSVHPGLFTDEAFMQASLQARLLMIGIWTECFDDGVFEWKPLTLKARIFPVDNCNVSDLLGELEGLDFIVSFDSGGKKYGAVRNFRKYQRPKNPTDSKHLPVHLRTYVALVDINTEPVGNVGGTSGEISPQMEDGGDNKEKEKEEVSSDSDSDFDAWYTAYPRHEAKGQARKAYRTARKKADGETLLAGANNASARYANCEKRFVPLPATWLNGERWLDDPAPPDEAKPKALTPAEEVDEMYRQMGIRKTW